MKKPSKSSSEKKKKEIRTITLNPSYSPQTNCTSVC